MKLNAEAQRKVEENLGLVHKVINDKVHGPYQMGIYSRDDLFQIGCIGLCKAAPLKGEDGIEDQDYSLNASRYVGVVLEDDGLTVEEFREEMQKLRSDFELRNQEANTLANNISTKLKGLGL